MKKADILGRIDHTLLLPNAVSDDFRKLFDEALRYGVASVCVPPAMVSWARRYLKGAVKVCTVVGFPLGYTTTEEKCWEAKQAILEGADEIDMVVNISWAASIDPRNNFYYETVAHEIQRLREVCVGDIVLKVIVEACYLTEAQKRSLCIMAAHAGADYIKTSTGFGPGGATIEDVKLFREHIGPNMKIKAAGGISTIEDAIRFIEAGADRIGSSKLVGLLAEDAREEIVLPHVVPGKDDLRKFS